MLHTFQQMGIFAILSLLVTVIPGVMGAAYAIWPNESKLALMRPLSLAGLFAGLAGFVGGIINVLTYADRQGVPFTASNAVLIGTAESLVPLAAAFGSLTLGWLLVALGLRRQG